ncbi:DUF4111 domain-containing protein [Kribbella sandramycini]|uniref:DUF4111 domain-containing protein n=1 Tax=Kribbella sandramycini TaxID=60450 RepID=A0A7Y4L2L8_9ACTN|nr:aminoglycoside adenylyltransferase domain-containing protein [Kribbella sandramycini]MBB6565783.1 streptomycin 3'-adenylyltransferase [Kribbella sandramycini]NOL42046.1 DUF4111 domain-containing protein [Kribbella sandramycini]
MMRGQSWADCDPDVREYVVDAVEATGLATAGVYVHGSLAMGCYYRGRSDVDLLVVVPEALPAADRGRAARALAERAAGRPMVGDLELSVLTTEQARTAVHPRPYEVHYSEAWTERILAGAVDYNDDGADPDLSAHISVVRARGATLSGPPPAELFAPVPHEHYLSAVLDDLHDIFDGDELFELPEYGVLNACRTLELLQNGSVLSKEEGALWALQNLPRAHHPLITQALTTYRDDTPPHWNPTALNTFRHFVLATIPRG